jgi:hypothetical protein
MFFFACVAAAMMKKSYTKAAPKRRNSHKKGTQHNLLDEKRFSFVDEAIIKRKTQESKSFSSAVL